jgi:beta-N-acetylhexosaminidase
VSLRLIRPQLGHVLVVGMAGDRVPIELTSLAREFGIGGVLLASRNLVDPLQVAELAREIQGLARDVPVWVGLHPDAPSRVPPATPWPALATLGRADALDLTTAFATALARERLALGLTLECAPVLDLASRRGSVAPSLAAIAPEAALVARHGARVVETLRAAGLATCARHFPGIGEADADAGGPCPVVDLPPDQLDAVEWMPFRAAIAAGVPAVMAAYVLVPGLDERTPAVQSSTILRDGLRGRLGFAGAIFSDDLDTWPAAALGEETPAVVRVLDAGVDVLVQAGGDMDRVAATLEHLVRAAERKDLSMSRLEDALRRHEAMKAAYLSDAARRGRPPLPHLGAVLGSSEADRVADRMREFA